MYIIYGYAVGSATNFKYIYLSISQIKMFLNLYKYVLVPFYIKNVWSKMNEKKYFSNCRGDIHFYLISFSIRRGKKIYMVLVPARTTFASRMALFFIFKCHFSLFLIARKAVVCGEEVRYLKSYYFFRSVR